MAKQGKVDPRKQARKRLVAFLGMVGLLAVAIVWGRGLAAPDETPPVEDSPSPSTADQPLTVPTTSDYSKRVVAYLYGSEPVTRKELGDYLIARKGKAALPLLIHRRIMERACRLKDIEVTAIDVETSLRESLDGVAGVPKDQFIKQVLKQYGKTLYEWKEDVIRPKLMLQRLCKDRITITEEDIHKAFESRYGEKVDCRIIIWPHAKLEEAQEIYPQIRDDDDAFHEAAKHQFKKGFASTAGRTKPISRYSLNDPKVEEIALRLRPGSVSELIDTKDGIVVLKCDKRIPADTTANLEAKRPELIQELVEKMLSQAMPELLSKLKEEAKVRTIVDDFTQPGGPGQVLAILYHREPITREDLGEFLIARHGADRLPLMINRRIIEKTCKAKGVTVSDEEIEAELAHDLKLLGLTEKLFEEKQLEPQGTSLYEWKHDVLRQRLLMDKLIRPGIKAKQDELKQAFEAYYGERVDCRIIMWPKAEERNAMREYAKLRDSEKEFAHRAKHQANSKLAAMGGKLEHPIGRRTTGNEELEREAFSLQPGEVSRLIGTPQGTVVLKCDRRIPADTSVKLADVRDKLMAEIIDKKVQIETPHYFAQLREEAQARLLLTGPTRVEDISASVKRELADSQRALDAAPPR